MHACFMIRIRILEDTSYRPLKVTEIHYNSLTIILVLQEMSPYFK